MRKAARTTARALAVATLGTAGVLTLASPAYAHPEITNLHCTGYTNSRFGCTVSYTGAHQPVTIRWYVNGRRDPSLDDKSHFIRGCARGERVTGKAVVSDVHGTDTLSDWAICGSDPD